MTGYTIPIINYLRKEQSVYSCILFVPGDTDAMILLFKRNNTLPRINNSLDIIDILFISRNSPSVCAVTRNNYYDFFLTCRISTESKRKT